MEDRGLRMAGSSKTTFYSLSSIFAALFAAAGLAADSNGQGATKTGYVDVSGTKLYYEECGSGPAVVLLHDGLLDSVSWDEI